MTISKSKFLLLLTLAMMAPAVALALFMDVPFGMQAEGRESAVVQPLSASDEAVSCDIITAPEGQFDEHSAGSGSSGSDFATNSGTISDAQFNDGGFGDIGQQWWNVNVNGPVINVHISGTDNTSVVTVGEDVLEGEGSSQGTVIPQLDPEPPATTTTTAPAPTTTTTLPSP